jgi:hypothetical protein
MRNVESGNSRSRPTLRNSSDSCPETSARPPATTALSDPRNPGQSDATKHPLHIASFGEDPQGELFILAFDGRIHKLVAPGR